ncbi:unnamed protein product [Spirodela intermedia]|uniref:Uncharacterized protein n=1 Tax=Spirodela intermedia TaxID=51605 RepID=A0A7I8IME7_SPIIN|nr:unnamed protein product [Spirodela intermedia]CAA6659135.1 unnamed protein product [Spirodela intermedia]
MNINDKLCLHNGTAKTNKHFYRSIIGGLMYLTHTCPDILFSIGKISRFMHSPSVHHLGVAKKILRHVRGTINYRILYQHDAEFIFSDYSNSDWTNSISYSNSGFVFSFS